MKPTLKIFKYILFILFLITNYSLSQNETNQTPTPQKPKLEVDHNKEIIFGQSFYQTGTFELYGSIIKNGILACFKKVNDEGGVQGKTLSLVSLNDKGLPLLAEENIKLMLNEYKIDMFLGNMGTRSVLKVLPLIKNKKIAIFFPWGGDETLRDPDLTNIISGPGLILPQLQALVKYIVEDLRFRRIGIFHDDGDFSIDNANQTINILEEYNIKPIKTASYNRFTMNINAAADDLISVDPKVIICLSTNMPTTRLISRFFEMGFYGASFLGIDSTFFVGNILKARGAKFYYTSAVPNPNDKSIPIVEQYQNDLKKYFPNETFNILSLTYYICAKIIVTAMKNITGEITKEKIIEQIERMQDFDLDGFNVNFDFTNRHAFGSQISIIKG